MEHGAALEAVHLDDAELEIPDGRQSLKTFQGLGLGDDHVVPGQHAHPGSAREGSAQRPVHERDPAVHDEGGDDIDPVRAGQPGAQVVQQMVLATGAETWAVRRRNEALASVVPLLGDDEADAASGVVYVAVVAGNDVDVEVVNRLSGADANVHADVETARVRRPTQPVADHVDQPHQVDLLFWCGLGPVRDDPPRNHQRVTGGHRVLVPNGEGQFAGRNPRRFGNFEEGGDDATYLADGRQVRPIVALQAYRVVRCRAGRPASAMTRSSSGGLTH